MIFMLVLGLVIMIQGLVEIGQGDVWMISIFFNYYHSCDPIWSATAKRFQQPIFKITNGRVRRKHLRSHGHPLHRKRHDRRTHPPPPRHGSWIRLAPHPHRSADHRVHQLLQLPPVFNAHRPIDRSGRSNSKTLRREPENEDILLNMHFRQFTTDRYSLTTNSSCCNGKD